MTLALIDGDILLYKAACGAEQKVKWPDGESSYSNNPATAIAIFENKMKEALKATKATDHLVCLSDSENFRKAILPDYKANRKDLRKPEGLHELRDYVIANHKVVILPTLEADDVMGIYATSSGDDPVIVTLDKDLSQIPVDIYNPDQKKWHKAKHREPFKLFMMQVLTGDEIDNFKGCPQVGPVKAEKLLKDLTDPEEMWKVVVEQFTKKGLTIQDALQQARVARILQTEDYINDTVIPWGKKYE